MSIEVNGSTVALNLKINNKRFAEVFADTDPQDWEEKFVQLLDAALAARAAFTVDLETQTIKKSVDEAIENLAVYFEEFKKLLGSSLEELVDPETGKFVETFETLVDSSLSDALDPFSEDLNMPLTRLRGHVDTLDSALRNYIEPMRQKLGIGGGGKDSGAGDNFESVVSIILEKQAGIMSDVAIKSGDIVEKGTTRKIGDLKIELPDHLIGGRPIAIDFEMKTDQSFKLLSRAKKPKIANESVILKSIDEMLEVTHSDAAVFILDDELLEMEHQARWKVLGPKKLLIVVNRIAPDENYIQLAYAWARWQATQSMSVEKQVFDKKDFETRLKNAITGLEDTTNILKKLGRSIDGINEARDSLGLMRDAVKKNIENILEDLASQ